MHASDMLTRLSVFTASLNGRLADAEWLAGGAYGIADIACWGWVWFHRMQGLALDNFPSVKRWFYAVSNRPAVQRGQQVGLEDQPDSVRQMMSGPYYEPPKSV